MQVDSVIEQPRGTEVATSIDLSFDLRLSLVGVLGVLVERAKVSKLGRDDRGQVLTKATSGLSRRRKSMPHLSIAILLALGPR